MCGGFCLRLAQKFVTVNEIVTRERVRGGPVECRGTNTIGGEKHNCQDKIQLHAVREASCPGITRIFANGPVVRISCRLSQGWHEFLHSHGRK